MSETKFIGMTANSIEESTKQLFNYYIAKEKKYRFLIIDILDALIKLNEMLNNEYMSYKITQYQDRLRILKEKRGSY